MVRTETHRCTEDPAPRPRAGPWTDRPHVAAELAAHRRAIVSAVSMWTYLQGRITPVFAVQRITPMADMPSALAIHAIDIEYKHYATGAAGTLALRSLDFFPDAPLLDAAGLGSHAARRLQARVALGFPAGVLLRVGIDQWYYWRATRLESWPHDIRSWPTKTAIDAAQARWERGLFDMETLAQCLITHDGYPY